MKLRERIIARSIPEPNSGCWLWLGSARNNRGYGVIKINKKTYSAHRVSFEVFNHPIPDGMFVLHRCDVPCCVNPNHLFVGTHLDNMRDMVSKGRTPKTKTEVHKARIADALKGKQIWLGKTHSEETKEKIRRANAGKPPMQAIRIAATLRKGGTLSEEHKAKIADGLRRYHERKC